MFTDGFHRRKPAAGRRRQVVLGAAFGVTGDLSVDYGSPLSLVQSRLSAMHPGPKSRAPQAAAYFPPPAPLGMAGRGPVEAGPPSPAQPSTAAIPPPPPLPAMLAARPALSTSFSAAAAPPLMPPFSVAAGGPPLSPPSTAAAPLPLPPSTASGPPLPGLRVGRSKPPPPPRKPKEAAGSPPWPQTASFRELASASLKPAEVPRELPPPQATGATSLFTASSFRPPAHDAVWPRLSEEESLPVSSLQQMLRPQRLSATDRTAGVSDTAREKTRALKLGGLPASADAAIRPVERIDHEADQITADVEGSVCVMDGVRAGKVIDGGSRRMEQVEPVDVELSRKKKPRKKQMVPLSGDEEMAPTALSMSAAKLPTAERPTLSAGQGQVDAEFGRGRGVDLFRSLQLQTRRLSKPPPDADVRFAAAPVAFGAALAGVQAPSDSASTGLVGGPRTSDADEVVRALAEPSFLVGRAVEAGPPSLTPPSTAASLPPLPLPPMMAAAAALLPPPSASAGPPPPPLPPKMAAHEGDSGAQVLPTAAFGFGTAPDAHVKSVKYAGERTRARVCSFRARPVVLGLSTRAVGSLSEAFVQRPQAAAFGDESFGISAGMDIDSRFVRRDGAREPTSSTFGFVRPELPRTSLTAGKMSPLSPERANQLLTLVCLVSLDFSILLSVLTAFCRATPCWRGICRR